MKFGWLVLLTFTALTGSVSTASGTERPELEIGDSWTYKRVSVPSNQVTGSYVQQVTGKNEDGYVLHVEGQGVFVPTKALSKNLGRIVEFDGRTSDSKWLEFPLSTGKTWKVRDDWKNQTGSTGFDELTYKVEGEEEITVEAGTFAAVKVSGTGSWNNTSNNVSGGVTVAIWYAPKAKAIVRYQRMNTFRNGTSSNDVVDLVKFSLN
jgi:hypothetical protein